MKRLVLDLRDNPGGPLDQAIRVANRFLPRGDMIVYTRGRVANSDQDYRATEESHYTHLPIVVLVNRNSASASEIVTGALQDHDRALIVGETTFGKALVQSVYRISEGAGLAVDDRPLLHAERPPDSAAVGRQLRRVPDLHAARSDRARASAQRRRPRTTRTAAARCTAAAASSPTSSSRARSKGSTRRASAGQLYARQVFENFAERFTAEGDTRIVSDGNAKNRRTLRRGFAVTDAMHRGVQGSCSRTRHVKVDEEAFTKDDGVHPRDDSLRDRPGALRRRRSAPKPDRARSAGAVRLGQFGEAEHLTAMARARAAAK